jgi:hypothetical protein
MDPRYIFPEAKALIGLAFRIPRGYLRGIEEGTHFYQYPSMGYANINEVYAPTVLHELACLLETTATRARSSATPAGAWPSRTPPATPMSRVRPPRPLLAARSPRTAPRLT